MPRAKKTAKIPAQVAAPAASLFERVAQYLRKQGWDYREEPEKSYFDLRIRVRDVVVRLIVDVEEEESFERVLVYSSFPVFAPEGRRANVIAEINRINFRLIFGNFEVDPADGEVRFRTVLTTDDKLSAGTIAQAVETNLAAAERHFPEIMAIAYGRDRIVETPVVPRSRRRSAGITLQ